MDIVQCYLGRKILNGRREKRQKCEISSSEGGGGLFLQYVDPCIRYCTIKVTNLANALTPAVIAYSEVESVVSHVCEAYERGEALGSLCSDLCTRHTLGTREIC
jgi:hypothetical protein